jgi:hypothetical protein
VIDFSAEQEHLWNTNKIISSAEDGPDILAFNNESDSWTCEKIVKKNDEKMN